MKRVCLICMNPKDTRVRGHYCLGKGSEAVRDALVEALQKAGMTEEVQIRETLCLKHCESGPVLQLMPDHSTYVGLKPEDMEEIVNSHLAEGKKVERLLFKRGFNRFF